MFLYALRREVLRNPVPRDVDVLHHTFLYALRREVLRNTAILMVRCVVLPGHLRGGGDQSTPDRLVEIGREFPQADLGVLQRGEKIAEAVAVDEHGAQVVRIARTERREVPEVPGHSQRPGAATLGLLDANAQVPFSGEPARRDRVLPTFAGFVRRPVSGVGPVPRVVPRSFSDVTGPAEQDR